MNLPRRLLLSVAAVAYAGVFCAFLLVERPGLGVGHFFYLPVCLVALATSPGWGAAAGVLGTALYALGVWVTPSVPVSSLPTASTAIRFVTFCGVGMLVGWYASSNRRLVAELRDHSLHDFLTGIGNARAFDECLARRCAAGLPFTLLLADVDNMKAINDRDGHVGGNEALRLVAAVLARHAGEDEEVARIGGDEFAILTARPAEEAALFSARLARALADKELYVSFASASSPRDGTAAVELFRKADDRLFLTKLGRSSRRTVLPLER